MRSGFYIAFAVAALAYNSFVVAFTNEDESPLFSNNVPDFAANAVVSNGPQKRFLRIIEPENTDLVLHDEERAKIKSNEIIKNLGMVKKVPKKTQKFASLQGIIQRLNKVQKASKKTQKYGSLKRIIEILDSKKTAPKKLQNAS
ncbi:RxLR effector protein [Phytophthora megakarya]|uniref:RxLR effector protein n=1 Tax=Phytophthora megakarya TaxID=4795 RepID=A0A225W1R1_9STRA|nr:RxLR effector protein [Phytophthora megakarya]